MFRSPAFVLLILLASRTLCQIYIWKVVYESDRWSRQHCLFHFSVRAPVLDSKACFSNSIPIYRCCRHVPQGFLVYADDQNDLYDVAYFASFVLRSPGEASFRGTARLHMINTYVGAVLNGCSLLLYVAFMRNKLQVASATFSPPGVAQRNSKNLN